MNEFFAQDLCCDPFVGLSRNWDRNSNLAEGKDQRPGSNTVGMDGASISNRHFCEIATGNLEQRFRMVVGRKRWGGFASMADAVSKLSKGSKEGLEDIYGPDPTQTVHSPTKFWFHTRHVIVRMNMVPLASFEGNK